MKKKALIYGMWIALVVLLAACGRQPADQPAGPGTPPEAGTEELQAQVQTQAPAPEPEPEPEPPIPYTDVPEDASYYDKVVWAYENGIASDGPTFEPGSACTRAQVIMFLWRAAGSPEPWIMENPFSDIAPSDWYYKPALWAYQNNITTSTAFNPKNLCSNGEALTFLWRAKGSPITLAASDAYYARAVKWAENNGMFDGMDSAFDPAAPCLRADIVTYLYWAMEQWEFTEEERAIQREYEKILNGSQYHGYADYIDTDGNGEAELLTLDYEYAERELIVTVSIYANVDGHVEKTCEKAFRAYGYTRFSIYKSDGQPYLCYNDLNGAAGISHEFFRIETETVALSDTVVEMIRYSEESSNLESLQKYTDEKRLFDTYRGPTGYTGITLLEQGIAPSWNEQERYWTAYWEATDPMYATVLRGDLSAFAGTYTYAGNSPYGGPPDIILDKDGIPTGEYVANQKPISISISKDGTITCEFPSIEDDEDGEINYLWEYYVIYPVGIGAKDPNDPDYQDDLSKVRIIYWYPSHGVEADVFSRIS